MIYFVIGPSRSGKSEFLRNITKNIVFDFWDVNIKLRNELVDVFTFCWEITIKEEK